MIFFQRIYKEKSNNTQ